MKWFKHMANARDDDFMEWVEETYGFEGVGRWWRILEIIASAMDKNVNDPSTQHTWTKWQAILRGKRSQLLSFLVAIEQRGKMKLEHNENILKITIPNLLKLRDEYSQKSRQVPDSVPTRHLQEAEADKEKELKPSFLPTPEPRQKIEIPNHGLKKSKDKNVFDLTAAAAACCSILHIRRLSPVDSTLLARWGELYDFEGYVMPLLAEATVKFQNKNNGKCPASLSYFADRVREKALPP